MMLTSILVLFLHGKNNINYSVIFRSGWLFFYLIDKKVYFSSILNKILLLDSEMIHRHKLPLYKLCIFTLSSHFTLKMHIITHLWNM